jgi:ABC-2 type transport system permease protein
MSGLRSTLRVVRTAAEMTFRMNVLDSFILFGLLIQPLIIATLALWILRDRGGDYAVFVVVGSGMTGLWSSLLFVSGNSITEERWTSTLECLVGAPTGLGTIVFGKNLANVLQSLASMVVSYLFAALLFGYPLRINHPGAFALSLFLTVLSFVAFGMVIAPVFVINPDVQRWQNALEFPVYILGGFLFPIALLPFWTTPVSYVLAPYWAARALHSSSSGTGDPGELALCWGMMVVVSLASLFLSQILMKRVLHKARADATLNLS